MTSAPVDLGAERFKRLCRSLMCNCGITLPRTETPSDATGSWERYAAALERYLTLPDQEAEDRAVACFNDFARDFAPAEATALTWEFCQKLAGRPKH
jgi:hypothetical protein